MNSVESTCSEGVAAMKVRTGRIGRGRDADTSRSSSARVIVGATEVMLLARDPHLAARAAWALLRGDDESPGDGELVGRPHLSIVD